MSRSALERLLAPRSIAVVGASDREGRIGTTVTENILGLARVPVHLVNPRGGRIGGVEALTSIAELPEDVDLGVIVVPAAAALPAVEQLAERGVGGVVVITSGFAESGDAGESLQSRLAELSRSTGVRICGPNCIGFMNLHDGVMANFALARHDLPTPGPVALVSQSGGFGSYLATKAVGAGLRLGFFVTTGNEVDVSVADVLETLVERDDVGVLTAFAESIRAPEALLRAAARASELDKPMLLLKAADSEAARRAALSHTASMVGSGEVLEAVCRQHGIIVADTMEELLDLALIFQDGRRTRGDRVGIMTTSGGAGVLLTGYASREGLNVPELPDAEQRRIVELMPQPFHGNAANPIDTTAQIGVDPQASGRVLNALLHSDVVDCFTCVTWAVDNTYNAAIVDSYQCTDKPFAVLCNEPFEPFLKSGVPSYLDPSRAMRALGSLAEFSRGFEVAAAVHEPGPVEQAVALIEQRGSRSMLLEPEAKALFRLYDVPTTDEAVVLDEDAAVAQAARIGWPVALKVVSADLPHKSDVGGVRLGLESEEGLREAFASMRSDLARQAPQAEILGFLVQEMVPARIELTCGLQRDPTFGPIVAVGLGGVLVEVMAQTRLLRAPFEHAHARAAVSSLCDGRLTEASRGITDAEADQVARVMVGIGRMAVDLPDLKELDANPLIVTPHGRVCVADGLAGIDVPSGGRSVQP